MRVELQRRPGAHRNAARGSDDDRRADRRQPGAAAPARAGPGGPSHRVRPDAQRRAPRGVLAAHRRAPQPAAGGFRGVVPVHRPARRTAPPRRGVRPRRPARPRAAAGADRGSRSVRWLPDLPTASYLSVNLSPHALLAPASFDLLTAAVRKAPDRIVVELTEHEQVQDYPALLGVLAGLRERGLRLAVDDTGSGFASLQHVTRLRPDIVKLDIAFVRDLHRDPSRRAVARALTAFATDIGASLVAEGIETPDELDELLRLGARYGQGYHLGGPAPTAQALSGSTTGQQPAAART